MWEQVYHKLSNDTWKLVQVNQVIQFGNVIFRILESHKYIAYPCWVELCSRKFLIENHVKSDSKMYVSLSMDYGQDDSHWNMVVPIRANRQVIDWLEKHVIYEIFHAVKFRKRRYYIPPGSVGGAFNKEKVD